MASLSLDESKAKDILRQVEFYFSDSNLPRDNFLRKTVLESEDGLVSVALLCSFSRMRGYLGLGAAKPDEVPEETVLAVAELLRKSSSLKVSEDGKKVGRSTELLKPEEIIEQVDSRTLSASPLPYDVKIEDVESFFCKYAKVNSVRLPRHVTDKRHSCGTALIEFSEESDAKRVLGEKLSYAGAELELKPKKDFNTERQKKRVEVERIRSSKDTSDGSYIKGLIIAFKLKSMPEEPTEQNGSENVNDGADISKSEASNSGEVVREDGEQKTLENDKKDQMSLEEVQKDNKDKVNKSHESLEVAIDDVPQEGAGEVNKGASSENEKKSTPSAYDKNVVTREDLKEIFQRFGTVKYVDYRMRGESGYIRFEDPEAAVKARAMAVVVGEGGIVVKNHIATLEALTGEAEKEYWSVLKVNQDRRRDNKNYTGRGGRRNKGGRQYDGKRSRQNDSADGWPNKAQKV